MYSLISAKANSQGIVIIYNTPKPIFCLGCCFNCDFGYPIWCTI